MNRNLSQYGYPTNDQLIKKINNKTDSMIGVGDTNAKKTTNCQQPIDQSGGHQVMCSKKR